MKVLIAMLSSPNHAVFTIDSFSVFFFSREHRSKEFGL